MKLLSSDCPKELFVQLLVSLHSDNNFETVIVHLQRLVIGSEPLVAVQTEYTESLVWIDTHISVTRQISFLSGSFANSIYSGGHNQGYVPAVISDQHAQNTGSVLIVTPIGRYLHLPSYQ